MVQVRLISSTEFDVSGKLGGMVQASLDLLRKAYEASEGSQVCCGSAMGMSSHCQHRRKFSRGIDTS
jgi:hypothetical protein